MLRHCLRRSIIPRTPFRPAILPPFRSTHYKASPSDEARSSSKSAQAARTDKTHAFKYPDGDVQASGHPISGTRRKPTLASFSLEGKTAVVTGGARGLGLVMAQGMLMSGADIALVDLNGRLLNRKPGMGRQG
jgi:D-arabinitol 2-dehydrogenase